MIYIKVVFIFFRKILSSLKLIFFQQKWRSINSHNHTTIINFFSFKNISVGKNTYGPLIIYRWNSVNEGLHIGNYCSIASGVKFILGGNHDLETISTYPFDHYYGNKAIVATSKGPIIIEDDVWIGSDVTILSGITIGRGSVIAAGSVVTRSYEAYSIIGGNPSKLIRYRFDEEKIERLKLFNYASLDENMIQENLSILLENIKDCSLDRLDILLKEIENQI